MNETIITLSKTVESLDERIEKKLDLLNKSNTAMSVQVQAMSQRLTALESRGLYKSSPWTLSSMRDIGVEPRRVERESRITCMRMLNRSQSETVGKFAC